MEIVETKQQIQCHCCTSEEDVHICELDNCDYPLCSTCKEKALKLEHKCPGCRREIIIDIKIIDELHLEPDLENLNNRKCINCSQETKESVVWYLYTYIISTIIIIGSAALLLLILMAGRLVTIIFSIGPFDFWCQSIGKDYFGWFIAYGLLGDVIGFFILCCSAGLINDCCCGEDSNGDW